MTKSSAGEERRQNGLLLACTSMTVSRSRRCLVVPNEDSKRRFPGTLLNLPLIRFDQPSATVQAKSGDSLHLIIRKAPQG